MGMQEGTRLCPSCANFSSLKHEVCQRCGYNFSLGSASGLHRPPPVIADSGAARSTTSQYKVVWVLVAALILAGAGGAFLFTLSDPQDGSVPLIGVPIDPDPPAPQVISRDAFDCYRMVSDYLEKLLANDGQGSRPLADIFTRATEQLGAGSDELRILLEVYGDQRVSAAAFLEGTRPALRAGEMLARKACKRAYR